jgi:signal peptidase I
MRFPLTAIHPCLTIFLVAVLLHPFTAMGGPRYRVFHIPSASMAPTVQLDDLVLVEVPPSWQPPIRPCDVVAYRKPAPAGAPEVDYLRRVVALPGDRVAYVSGRLRLNGVVVPREQVGTGEQVTIYRETLPIGPRIGHVSVRHCCREKLSPRPSAAKREYEALLAAFETVFIGGFAPLSPSGSRRGLRFKG